MITLDRYMRKYWQVLGSVFPSLLDKSVIDFGAGNGWIREYGFTKYIGLDVAPIEAEWARRWDFDEELPEVYCDQYEVAVSMNSIHYATDPNHTITQFLKALKDSGTMVISAPWLYPPHDRSIDRWRLSPRLLFRLLNPHFESVEIHSIGTLFDLPTRIIGRFLGGPFRGFKNVKALELYQPLRPRSEDEISTSLFGPLTTVAIARGFRRKT